jgi:hypothetical protein
MALLRRLFLPLSVAVLLLDISVDAPQVLNVKDFLVGHVDETRATHELVPVATSFS